MMIPGARVSRKVPLSAARSAAVLRLEEIAATIGVSTSLMHYRLRSLPVRGPCAAAAGAQAMKNPAAVNAPFVSPAAVRRAAQSPDSQVSRSARGAAGWARPLPSRPTSSDIDTMVEFHYAELAKLAAPRWRALARWDPDPPGVGQIDWRVALAGVNALPTALMRVLLDRSAAAREVLRNPTCPADVLAEAALRSDTLRAAAAAHPSCPKVVHEMPAADPGG